MVGFIFGGTYALQRREQWLARAQESAPEERAPALVTAAEMQMRRGQNDAAVTTLEVRERVPQPA